MTLKKNDLIISNFNGRFHPQVVMVDSNDINNYIARSAGMRQDYNYKKDGQYIVCNLGAITFTEFYENYETLCPEYKEQILKEFEFIVTLIDIKRENNRVVPVIGTTKKEIYLNKIKQFPLS